jgi:hypothetical protein
LRANRIAVTTLVLTAILSFFGGGLAKAGDNERLEHKEWREHEEAVEHRERLEHKEWLKHKERVEHEEWLARQVRREREIERVRREQIRDQEFNDGHCELQSDPRDEEVSPEDPCAAIRHWQRRMWREQREMASHPGDPKWLEHRSSCGRLPPPPNIFCPYPLG